MKRSTFFLATAILSALFGGMMLLLPGKAADGFGIASTPHHLMFLRAMGEAILAMGALNFLVRHDEDSRTLRSVLVLNALYHLLGLGNDFYSVAQKTIGLVDTLPGIVTHLFIGVGSVIYMLKVHTAGARDGFDPTRV
jgi:hypothetical protein